MGSSNGTWVNSHQLLAGKKSIYKSDDIIHLGKATSQVTITIEKISVQKAKTNSDEEKTLIYKMPVKLEQSSEAVITKKVANGVPEAYPIPTKNLTKTSMRLVENLTESRVGLGDKVKNLINLEADKIRQQATLDSSQIIKQAHENKNEILEKAQIQAKKIILKARTDAQAGIKNSQEEIKTLSKEADAIKKETEHLINNHKSISANISHTINELKKEESEIKHNVKSLEMNITAIQEKISFEVHHLQDIKSECLATRKAAEIKLEEIFTEERRTRSRIETDLIESRVQAAKVFAEAEKVQSQKFIIENEISELRSTKGQFERDINEQQINFKRQEFELEKLTYEYNSLLNDKTNEQTKHEKLLEEIKELSEKFINKENALIDEQKELQQKVNELKVIAGHLIQESEQTAMTIIVDAQNEANDIRQDANTQLRNLEDERENFYSEVESMRAAKLQEVENEIKNLWSLHSEQIKKDQLENQKKSHEIKELEESVKIKCQKISLQAQKDAETLKTKLQIENLNYKASLESEFAALKALHIKENLTTRKKSESEIQNLLDQANKELEKLKTEAELDIAAKNVFIENHLKLVKEQASKIIAEEKAKWDNKHQKLQAELNYAEELTIKQTKIHTDALAKTEALKDENYLHAQEHIKQMIAEANSSALELRRVASEQIEKEHAHYLEMKEAESLKHNALIENFELSKVKYFQEKAEHASLAVHEFMINELIKQRNLVLNESLIKKIAERARKLVVEATLGRIQASENGIKPFPTKNYNNILKWVFRVCALFAFLYMAYYVWIHYPDEIKSLLNNAENLIRNTNLSKDDIPSKDQIIEILR